MKYLIRFWDNFVDLMEESYSFILCFVLIALVGGATLAVYFPGLAVNLIFSVVIGRVLFGIFTGK